MGLGFRERDLVQKRVGLGLDSGILEFDPRISESHRRPTEEHEVRGIRTGCAIARKRDGRIGLVWFWGLCTAAV